MARDTTDDQLNASSTDAAPKDSERVMSLMTGVARSEDLPEAADEAGLQHVADGGRGLNQAALFLLIFLFAAGALYAMRMTQGDLGGDEQARDVEARIEQALAKLSKSGSLDAADPLHASNLQALFANTDTIIAMFANDPTRQQVPIEYIKKNPFAIDVPRPADPNAQAPITTLSDHAAQKRLKELQVEFNDLELQTVMHGRLPVAIINGELLQVGQQIGSFTVSKIGDLSVELQSDGTAFTLEMEDPSKAEAPVQRRR